MIFRLSDSDDVDSMLIRSDGKPQLLLKHSTRCPMSRLALRECEVAANGTDGFDLCVLSVIESPALARLIEETTAIRHESPQTILFRSGRAVWNASHEGVAASAIQKVLTNMTEEHAGRFAIRATTESDGEWLRNLLTDRWGATLIVTRGKAHDASRLPAFLAVAGEQRLGLVTYRIDGNDCEMVSLDSLHEGIGIGEALIKAVVSEARQAGCTRLWLITTNDNLQAVRFYQKRGFSLVAVHRNALVESRKIKPQIPEVGIDGIPLRDEIEMEMILSP
jgi:bacillithiol system protein YtxJ